MFITFHNSDPSNILGYRRQQNTDEAMLVGVRVLTLSNNLSVHSTAIFRGHRTFSYSICPSF